MIASFGRRLNSSSRFSRLRVPHISSDSTGIGRTIFRSFAGVKDSEAGCGLDVSLYLFEYSNTRDSHSDRLLRSPRGSRDSAGDRLVCRTSSRRGCQT